MLLTDTRRWVAHSLIPERFALSDIWELYPKVIILALSNGFEDGRRSRSHILSLVLAVQVWNAFPFKPWTYSMSGSGGENRRVTPLNMSSNLHSVAWFPSASALCFSDGSVIVSTSQHDRRTAVQTMLQASRPLVEPSKASPLRRLLS